MALLQRIRNGFYERRSRQIYSAAIAFPKGQRLMCSTAALTEKSGLPSPLKLLSSASKYRIKVFSLARCNYRQGDEENQLETDTAMFLSVVPSRHRRSQIVFQCAAVTEAPATVVSTPFLLSITVSKLLRVVDILENST